MVLLSIQQGKYFIGIQDRSCQMFVIIGTMPVLLQRSSIDIAQLLNRAYYTEEVFECSLFTYMQLVTHMAQNPIAIYSRTTENVVVFILVLLQLWFYSCSATIIEHCRYLLQVP